MVREDPRGSDGKGTQMKRRGNARDDLNVNFVIDTLVIINLIPTINMDIA